MTRISKPLFAVLMMVSFTVAAETEILKDDEDRINYSLGYQMGMDLLKQGIDLKAADVRQGLTDGYGDKAPRVNPALMQQALSRLKKEITEEMQQGAVERVESRRLQVQQLRKQSDEFFEKVKQDPDVVALESGLHYKVLQKGSGKVSPVINDSVSVHYTAKTMRGLQFDSTVASGTAKQLKVNQLIPGLSEALKLMKSGDKWQVFIPPDLAYGRKSPLANQAILIEIELLEVLGAEG